MKKLGKFESYLVCEKVVNTTSKSGNTIYECTFRDVHNRKYMHYISCNKRSEVWTRNLLYGSGVNCSFDNLLMETEVFHQDPFSHCRGKVFKCVWSREKNFANPIVSEIYNTDKLFMKREVVEDRYMNCWWHNTLAAQTGTCKSEKDWPQLYYSFSQQATNSNKEKESKNV